MQRNVWMAACLIGALAGASIVRADQEIYRDKAYPFGERAVDLVSRMTLSEKAQQLLCGRAPRAPGIERLGVRPYEWWSEALHGVARDGTATSFPTGLGLGATWNPELIEQMGRVTSDEARDKFNDSESPHGLAYWSPTINLSRDPRWGRAEEAYGEDPYHTGRIACGFIHGMQGEHEPNGNGSYLKTFATPKHFLANNSECNRLFGSSNLTETALREYYTYAFKMAIEEGKAQSIMTSYNAVNGVPMSVNTPILDEILRRTWGFEGYITTDCDTIEYIIHRHTWRPEGWQGPWTLEGAVAASVRAGVDANCGRSVSCGILGAIKQGLLTEDDMDRSLVRLFTARMRSGEFDPDGGPFGKINGCIHNAKAQALAQKVAEEAVVLLKNADGILPLTKSLGGKRNPRLVLVGQRADKVTLGDYSTHEPKHTSTILEGVRSAFLRHYPQGIFTHIRGGGTDNGNRRFLMNVQPPALLRADGSVVAQLDWRKASALNGCKVEEAGNLGYMEPSANPLCELWFWDTAAKRQTYDLGQWQVQVGPNAATAALSQAFTLEGELKKQPHALIATPSGHFLSVATPEKHITVSASLSYTDQTVRRDVPFRYSSSNPSVASVDAATGVVTAHRPGIATITTTCEGRSASFPVYVRSE